MPFMSLSHSLSWNRGTLHYILIHDSSYCFPIDVSGVYQVLLLCRDIPFSTQLEESGEGTLHQNVNPSIQLMIDQAC